MAVLEDHILGAPFPIVDARDALTRHSVKRWERRNPAGIIGVCYHQSLGLRYAGQVARYHAGPNHISPDGLPGIAYTLFVSPSGDVLLCNDVEARTWSQGDASQAGDENALYVAVCFGGDFSGLAHRGTDSLTTEQAAVAIPLWKHLCKCLGLERDALYGHHDFGKAACPGYALSALIAMVRDGGHHDKTRIMTCQERLRAAHYYGGEVDGMWGPQSQAALVNFQRDFGGLAPNGVRDRATLRALRL